MWIPSLIFVAGGFGAICRYGVGEIVSTEHLPWGTWTVNVVGSFLIGFISILAISYSWSPVWRYILITGFLGGFTTFSAFSLESVQMLGERPLFALGYIASKILICFAAAALGIAVAKFISF